MPGYYGRITGASAAAWAYDNSIDVVHDIVNCFPTDAERQYLAFAISPQSETTAVGAEFT